MTALESAGRQFGKTEGLTERHIVDCFIRADRGERIAFVCDSARHAHYCWRLALSMLQPREPPRRNTVRLGRGVIVFMGRSDAIHRIRGWTGFVEFDHDAHPRFHDGVGVANEWRELRALASHINNKNRRKVDNDRP